MNTLLYVVVGISGLGAMSCGAAPGINMPRSLSKTAAFELGCPAEDLVGTNLGHATHGVSGCGKKATYVCARMAYGICSGPWLLNSKDEGRGQTSAPVEP